MLEWVYERVKEKKAETQRGESRPMGLVHGNMIGLEAPRANNAASGVNVHT